MDKPSLMDWVFDKENPLDDKDNPPNAEMFFINYDPKTGSFVPTLLIDKPFFHFSTIRTKNTDNTKNSFTPPRTPHEKDTTCKLSFNIF